MGAAREAVSAGVVMGAGEGCLRVWEGTRGGLICPERGEQSPGSRGEGRAWNWGRVFWCLPGGVIFLLPVPFLPLPATVTNTSPEAGGPHPSPVAGVSCWGGGGP